MSAHVTPSTPGAAAGFSARSRLPKKIDRHMVEKRREPSSCLAASRNRANPCDRLARLCVRCVLCWSAFPLASPLPSTASGLPALGTAYYFLVPPPFGGARKWYTVPTCAERVRASSGHCKVRCRAREYLDGRDRGPPGD